MSTIKSKPPLIKKRGTRYAIFPKTPRCSNSESVITIVTTKSKRCGGSNGRTARRFFSKLTYKLHLSLSRCVGVTSGAAAAEGGPLLWPPAVDSKCDRRHVPPTKVSCRYFTWWRTTGRSWRPAIKPGPCIRPRKSICSGAKSPGVFLHSAPCSSWCLHNTRACRLEFFSLTDCYSLRQRQRGNVSSLGMHY